MNLCIVDKNAPREVFNNLESLNYNIIKSCEMEVLSTSISTHPDMQVFKLDDSRIIVEPSVFEYYRAALSDYEIEVICGSKLIGSTYPESILYNAATTGGILIHNTKYTDECILGKYSETINVKQGYSKCSIVELPNGIITSDAGIYKNVKNLIPSLLIESGHIELSGYDYGFIGGASGYSNKLYFAGDIKAHPSYGQIEKFLDNMEIECVSLSNGKLVDIGSIIFLK